MLGRWLSRGIISCNISQQQPLCILRMGIYFIISAHLFLPDQYEAKVLISSYYPLLESITHFKAYQSCSLWDPSTTAVNDTVGPEQLWVMLMKLVDNAPKAWILLKSNPIDFKKMKERKKKNTYTTQCTSDVAATIFCYVFWTFSQFVCFYGFRFLSTLRLGLLLLPL